MFIPLINNVDAGFIDNVYTFFITNENDQLHSKIQKENNNVNLMNCVVVMLECFTEEPDQHCWKKTQSPFVSC